MIKIWRSPYSEFGKFSEYPNDLHDETVNAIDVYDDETLAGIAANGFNGIWVHGLLRNMVKSDEFPEFGKNSEVHLNNLRQLIARAAQYGIKVYIYMQPPRAIPAVNKEFWNNHPEVAGHVEYLQNDSGTPVAMPALCTSTAPVKNFLRNSSARLAESLPGLGGVIMITASEYPSHCVARTGNTIGAMGERIIKENTCPRCAEREPADIISEIISLVRDGIRSVSDEPAIMAWNWSWSFYYDIPCAEIISKLPKDVILLTGFERGGRKDYCGRKNAKVDEYSISFAGPSEQFMKSFEVAKENGLQMGAKLQFATTHELASVPNLPLIGNIFKKSNFLRRNNIAGFMGCWNMGNMLSANTAGFNYFLSPECPDDEYQALESFASSYMPGCDTGKVIAAWYKFDEAMANYPFCIPFLYASCVNYAPAYVPYPAPLDGKPAGRSWLNDERGDDLSGSLSDFSLDEVIAGFSALSKVWAEGVELLGAGLADSGDKHAAEELNNAKACGAVFRSTFHAYSIYKLRLDWNESKFQEYRRIISDEIDNLKAVLPALEQDSRLGFHSEAQVYMFSAETVKNKLNELTNQLQQN